jgi:hypothetical protein
VNDAMPYKRYHARYQLDHDDYDHDQPGSRPPPRDHDDRHRLPELRKSGSGPVNPIQMGAKLVQSGTDKRLPPATESTSRPPSGGSAIVGAAGARLVRRQSLEGLNAAIAASKKRNAMKMDGKRRSDENWHASSMASARST